MTLISAVLHTVIHYTYTMHALSVFMVKFEPLEGVRVYV